MKLNRLLRKLHFWGALLIALPLLVVIVSGLFLQVKKEVEWIQPSSMRGSQLESQLTLDQIYQAATTVSELAVSSWQDIDRIDIRPDKKIAKVRSNNGYEAQLDLSNAQLLKVAPRRSDIIEQLHDGSWFHSAAKLWLFLPVAIGLLLLWISGAYMLFITLRNKRRGRINKSR